MPMRDELQRARPSRGHSRLGSFVSATPHRLRASSAPTSGPDGTQYRTPNLLNSTGCCLTLLAMLISDGRRNGRGFGAYLRAFKVSPVNLDLLRTEAGDSAIDSALEDNYASGIAKLLLGIEP